MIANTKHTSVFKEKIMKFADDKVADIHAEIYTSAMDVASDCQSRPVRISDYAVEQHYSDKEWYGVSTYQEAIDLLEGGYQAAVTDLQKAIAADPHTEPRISFQNNIQGFIPVVPLMLLNVPNNMIDVTMRPLKSKVIDLYYDMTACSGHSAKEFIDAGTMVLSTIVSLEKQGYRLNLYAVQSYTRDNKVDFLCIKLKSSDRPTDIKRISFPLTHPAFFRVIGFDWQGKSPITRFVGWGRGHDLLKDYTNEDVQCMANAMFGNNSVYISGVNIMEHGHTQKDIQEILTYDRYKQRNMDTMSTMRA
jgi:hypothetical protein